MGSLKLSNATSKYGASMGRRDFHIARPFREFVSTRLNLAHVRLNGDYDSGGAYWGGGGLPLYRVAGEFEGDDIEFFIRANNRDHAKEQIRALGYTHARFYR
jgi:hypothetical protein